MNPGKKIFIFAFFLGIWQLAFWLQPNDVFFASPIQVLQRLRVFLLTPSFWLAVFYSTLRIVLGFLIGLVVATIVAVLAWQKPLCRQFFQPLLHGIKAIPIASIIILLLIWFPSVYLGSIISFLMVLPIAYTNLLEGIESCPKDLLEMGNVFRLNTYTKFTCIYLPHLKSYILAGFTVAVGLSWKAGIAGEVIGMPLHSIGENLQQAKVYLDTADLFAWTVVILILSITMEFLLRKLILLLYRWGGVHEY